MSRIFPSLPWLINNWDSPSEEKNRWTGRQHHNYLLWNYCATLFLAVWFQKWLKTKHVTLMWITDSWYWASHPVPFSEERVPPLELRNVIQVWLSLSLLYFIKILQLDKRCNNFTFSHLLYMWSLNAMITVKEYLTAPQICQQITKQLLHARF